jgi:hypothetical protein
MTLVQSRTPEAKAIVKVLLSSSMIFVQEVLFLGKNFTGKMNGKRYLLAVYKLQLKLIKGECKFQA